MQVGVKAASELLRAFWAGTENPRRVCTVIVDLTAHTGDFLKAAIPELAHQSLYYIGACTTDARKEWLQAHLVRYIANELLTPGSSLKLAGEAVTLPPAAPPTESLSAAPPKPVLSTLTYNDAVQVEGRPTLKIPDHVMRKWHDHQAHGLEFRTWCLPQSYVSSTP